MHNHSLSPEEQAIENAAEQFEPVASEKKEEIEHIIDNMRKNRAISMRISSFDLDLLKKRAQKEGVPYQTLINAIIHKYVTNQLLEKDEALKVLHLIR